MLINHGRDYLEQEQLELEAFKKEQAEAEIAEAERKRKEEYIEQFYGDRYDNEKRDFGVEKIDRPTTVIPGEDSDDILFVNEVNQGNLREAIVSALKDLEHREMTQIKEISLTEYYPTLDRYLRGALLQKVVKEKDETPVFDFEV